MMAIDPQGLMHWSDDHLVVAEKPPGLRLVPDGIDPALPHLMSILEPDLGRLWIVHRLDKLTSGLLVLARSASVHRDLTM
jgi:23S rRNA-/tRNA-specific pseudouridylate synthase